MTYHPNFIYFADRFGLKLFGTVEPKPGIPPTPRHLAELAEAMKKAGVKVVVYQPYYSADASNELATRRAASRSRLPPKPAACRAPTTSSPSSTSLVSSVAGALAGKSGGGQMNFLTVMALPLLACLLLALILPTLGRHVLARGVIFVDLALAQIAALGQSVAFLLGADPHDPSMYYWSFGFTLLGAALFSFLWDREHSVLQEAFIGISFALATAATLLMLSNAPHGAEHVRAR